MYNCIYMYTIINHIILATIYDLPLPSQNNKAFRISGAAAAAAAAQQKSGDTKSNIYGKSYLNGKQHKVYIYIIF